MEIDLNKFNAILNEETKESEWEEPENFNKTEDIWVAVYTEGGNKYAQILSHKYPIQSEVLDMIVEEYELGFAEEKNTGVYIISGSAWGSKCEWSGEYDAGFDINEEEIIFDPEKYDLKCDRGEYKVLFLVSNEDTVILKYNKEFWDLPDVKFGKYFTMIEQYVPEQLGIYMMSIRPINYFKNSVTFHQVKKLDIPEGEERW